MSKRKDYVGQVFGKLTVVEQCDDDGKPWCLCRCECGGELLILANRLVTARKTHCGCSYPKRQPTASRVGERWGRLEVIGASDQRCPRGYFMWLCRCECGKKWLVSGHNLKPGGTESCGCRRQPRHDLVTHHEGQVYYDLTVLRREGSNSSGNATWLCRCICGTETVVIGSNLVTGNTKSCGCRLGRSASTNNLKHGRAKDYLGRLHDNIKQRCHNVTNKAYVNYGGRGITLAHAWQTKAGFIAGVLAEIGERPSPRHSFDRVDNELGYQPGNVRWSTRSEQSLNRRMGRDTEPMKVSAKEMRERIAELEAEIERLRNP